MSSRSTLIVGFLAVLLLLGRFYQNSQTIPRFHDGAHVHLSTTIRTSPQIQGKYQRFSFVADDNSKITIITSLYPEFTYGDVLHISGTLMSPGNSSRSGQSSSGSKTSSRDDTVLGTKQPVFTMYFPTITREEATSILTPLVWFRSHTVALFERTLPPTAASLLLGIVFGIKEGMPKDFSNELSQVGVVHVIAASGMNVTMVAAFLSSLFAFFFRRQVALLVSIVGILLYGLLSGFEPSIMRASLMAIVAFSAQILGRQQRAMDALFLAGFAMLFVSPQLVTDIGFQLSFASTLGLLLMNPIIAQNTHLQALLERSFIGEDIATTITAQLATLPILLANFGTYSLWSILVNGLVLWVIPPLMIVGGAAALVGMIIPVLGQMILYLALPFLWYFEQIVRFFAGKGLVTIAGLPMLSIVGYYCLFFALLVYYAPKQHKAV